MSEIPKILADKRAQRKNRFRVNKRSPPIQITTISSTPEPLKRVSTPPTIPTVNIPANEFDLTEIFRSPNFNVVRDVGGAKITGKITKNETTNFHVSLIGERALITGNFSGLFPFYKISAESSQQSSSPRTVYHGILSPLVVDGWNKGVHKISGNLSLEVAREVAAGALLNCLNEKGCCGHIREYLSNFVDKIYLAERADLSQLESRVRWICRGWERDWKVGNSLHLFLRETSQNNRPIIGMIHISKRLLGSICLGVIEYWVVPSHLGQGLASLMTTIALHWARYALGINTAHFDVNPDNQPSLKIVKKLGAFQIKVHKHKERYESQSGLFLKFRIDLETIWPWSLGTAQRDYRCDMEICTKPPIFRRLSVPHLNYFAAETVYPLSPGELAHSLGVPVSGAGVALRKRVSGGSFIPWFILFIDDFGLHTRSEISNPVWCWKQLADKMVQSEVASCQASIVDLNQTESTEMREFIAKRFDLDLDCLPQARLLSGTRVLSFSGDLTNFDNLFRFIKLIIM